ncbi:hypothetical protein N7468_002937 [Penicillium chermesinum]|uniref:PH domain protein n=1 Tax=Penicillium chermesinum TaxID=63820 RepID=A0A9W9P865_9EURO|nr:uncharacterized protein N7468_002937 [Penicillium chermesinum]KAJ5238318.1 hypothetical protein N7468_002937 [Penicillium chermesinum]KAJ6163986.1 hypothetical protein N7470_002658 [Penicillium chermesinum]
MSNALWSMVGKRVLNEHARNKFGMEDPYFEEVPASRLNRAFGKKKTKRRKAIPPGLSEQDANILTKVKRRAYRLDYCLFNLCGIRFGWGSVIGLIPFVGDAGDAALAMMVVKSCEGIEGGLPSRLRMMMLINVAIDFVIGLVPFIGDLADAVYKCNTRNAVLLEKHLREKGAKRLAKENRRVEQQEERDRREQRTIDYSLSDEFDRQEDGVVENVPPGYEEAQQNQPARPKPARKAQGRSKWFGGAAHPQEDPERGI